MLREEKRYRYLARISLLSFIIRVTLSKEFSKFNHALENESLILIMNNTTKQNSLKLKIFNKRFSNQRLKARVSRNCQMYEILLRSCRGTWITNKMFTTLKLQQVISNAGVNKIYYFDAFINLIFC